jgi:50S ribosomal subunit-associated GTPase HflX
MREHRSGAMHLYAASIRIVDALRTKGGIGMRTREIETDRRIVRDRIALLKDKIKAIDKWVNATRQSWRDGSCGSGRIY